MTIKVSDIHEGTKVFCISVSHRVRPIDTTPCHLGIYELTVFGPPFQKDGKLMLGLGFSEDGGAPDRLTAVDVIGDVVPHYYLSREEAESVLKLAKINQQDGFDVGVQAGIRKAGYVHCNELKAGVELFFVEKQPAELSHPIALAEQYRPGKPSLVIGHWKLVHDGLECGALQDKPPYVSITVGSDRPGVSWNYNLTVDHEGFVPHFYLDRDVAQRHLDTAQWAINSFTH